MKQPRLRVRFAAFPAGRVPTGRAGLAAHTDADRADADRDTPGCGEGSGVTGGGVPGVDGACGGIVAAAGGAIVAASGGFGAEGGCAGDGVPAAGAGVVIAGPAPDEREFTASLPGNCGARKLTWDRGGFDAVLPIVVPGAGTPPGAAAGFSPAPRPACTVEPACIACDDCDDCDDWVTRAAEGVWGETRKVMLFSAYCPGVTAGAWCAAGAA